VFQIIRREWPEFQEHLNAELFKQAHHPEEALTEPAMLDFCMTDLYATLPGCDCGPIRLDAYRQNLS
jgi:hypothetical protein